MKILKNEKDVTNPILQTNVIRKNPLYHKCYNLYKFIERYNNLGVNYSIDEKYTLLNEEERQEMNANLLSSFLSLKSKAPVKVNERIARKLRQNERDEEVESVDTRDEYEETLELEELKERALEESSKLQIGEQAIAEKITYIENMEQNERT